ncbi:hypothetical protein BCR34DRAFT_262017 [Clohesyomyces aquaticus]|uniref:Uncharacterized protein n=1 Tax=Clohesyomyces aquaticus TaxID=1231657 RepID=A0A1Y1ZTQ7_9PLEO|nr:hypothetical protein BCR34DRAFT_262017 [Clohesyomyces aquaticus]
MLGRSLPNPLSRLPTTPEPENDSSQTAKFSQANKSRYFALIVDEPSVSDKLTPALLMLPLFRRLARSRFFETLGCTFSATRGPCTPCHFLIAVSTFSVGVARLASGKQDRPITWAGPWQASHDKEIKGAGTASEGKRNRLTGFCDKFWIFVWPWPLFSISFSPPG